MGGVPVIVSLIRQYAWLVMGIMLGMAAQKKRQSSLRLRLTAEVIKILNEEEIEFPNRGLILGLIETAWDRMANTKKVGE